MKILVLENENIDSYGFQSLDDDYIDEIVKQDWNDVAIDDNDQYWNYNKIVNELDYQDYNGVKIKDNISDLFWDSNWIVHRIYYGCERINESWDDSDVIDEIHDEVIYQNWDDDKKNRIGIKYNQ